MDNRKIELCLEGRSDFELAMKIAVERKETLGYRVHDNKLILYWAESSNMTALPYNMKLEQIIEFVWGWLMVNKPKGKEPDHDGSNGKGFRVFNESWGQVAGEWQAYIAIEPIWAMYGK